MGRAFGWDARCAMRLPKMKRHTPSLCVDIPGVLPNSFSALHLVCACNLRALSLPWDKTFLENPVQTQRRVCLQQVALRAPLRCAALRWTAAFRSCERPRAQRNKNVCVRQTCVSSASRKKKKKKKKKVFGGDTTA